MNPPRVKYWEIIAGNLSKAWWSLGWVSAVDSDGRPIFVADAHRDDGKRLAIHADEKLTAFLELESAIRSRKLHTGTHESATRVPIAQFCTMKSSDRRK